MATQRPVTAGGTGRRKALLFVAIAACAVAFLLGWEIGRATKSIIPPAPFRLSGYQYISPLISCNLSSVKAFSQDQPVLSAVQNAVAAHQGAGDVADASVYFGDFTSGQWASVNGSDKFYPASLGKLPILMAYYAMAEGNSGILSQTGAFPVGTQDQNAQQEIPPAAAITPGKPYTNEELIEYMMKYSDNDAAEALTTFAPAANVQQVYSVYNDLGVPVNKNVTVTSTDFMTVQQYSMLFRALYNATYLSRDYSEKALGLMTQTDFPQGIVAGVPTTTVVSHKYGLASFTDAVGHPYQWELHDCGIVYAPSHAYLLCVMTKGTKSIAAQESAIADISAAVYKAVED